MKIFTKENTQWKSTANTIIVRIKGDKKKIRSPLTLQGLKEPTTTNRHAKSAIQYSGHEFSTTNFYLLC